jgi:F1F0 ATPase subunit 2
MMDILYFIVTFIAGMALGLFYFGTLWLTLRYLPKARRPEILTLGGFFVRTAITLFGFYLIMGGRWERLLIAFVGFILARIFITRRLRPGDATSSGQVRSLWIR